MRCRLRRYMWGDTADAGSVGICGGIQQMQAV